MRSWLAASVVLMTAAPASAAGAAFSFSAPEQVASRHPLNAVACPSAALCVAVGDHGQAITSINPAGGAGAWVAADVAGSSRLISFACASVRLCVATDNHSGVVSSTNPTGGSGGWSSPAVIDPGKWLNGISCPTARLCVVIDRRGGVLTSTHPTGGAHAWSQRRQLSKVALTTISCPSTRLCVATEVGKHVLVSTNPTGGPRSWHELKVARGQYDLLQSVSCPSVSLCIATDYTDTVSIDALSASNPTVASSWHDRADLDDRPHEGTLYSSVACGSPQLCVVIDGSEFGGPTLSVSTNPAHAWSAATFPGSDSYNPILRGVACAGSSLCAIVTSDGSVIVGT